MIEVSRHSPIAVPVHDRGVYVERRMRLDVLDSELMWCAQPAH
jgi:hypothetical protein